MAMCKDRLFLQNDQALRCFVVEFLDYLDQWFSQMARTRHGGSAFYTYAWSTRLLVPGWLYLHGAFLCLDVCRFTLASLDFILGQKPFTARFERGSLTTQISRLKENVRRLCTAVRQHASDLRKDLQDPDAVKEIKGVALGLLEDPVGKELRTMVDEPWLEETVDKLRTSWIEALNGINEIKVF